MNDFELWLNRFLTLQGKSLAGFMEHEPKNLAILQIGWDAATASLQAKLDAQAEELAALREYATDYLDDLINDTSYRSPGKEIAYQSYVARLKFLIDKAPLTGNSE
jgi:hypothetical protein